MGDGTGAGGGSAGQPRKDALEKGEGGFWEGENKAELQGRMSIDFPATAGKCCHRQIHKQEALNTTNIWLSLTKKKSSSNHDVGAGFVGVFFEGPGAA